MAVKKKSTPKPEVIAPINTGATLIKNFAGYGATPAAAQVDELAPYRQSAVRDDIFGSTPIAPSVPIAPLVPLPKIPADVPPPKKDPVYDALVAAMGIYKVDGLAATLEQIRMDYPDISSEDMLTLLRNDARYNKGYLTRFSGNQRLLAAGKPMLDERTYLQNEIAYDSTFKAYGVDVYFSNAVQYADLIANSKAPTEVANIVSAGFNRVINAEPSTLDTYKRFFSALTTQDIVAGLIGGKETTVSVERKITSAEIGGSAVRQGLNAFQAATDIKNARYSNLIDGTIGTNAILASGATRESTRISYEKIAGDLPRSEFLSSISAGQAEQYGQREAEKADILGLASEKRKLEILKDLERNRFKAEAGAAKNAFTSAKQMY